MRDRLIYLLKHSAFLQKLYLTIMSVVFRVWGAAEKTDERLILFVSFMGKGFNDSPKVLYEAIRCHPEYRCVWAFEQPEKYPELETVKIDSPGYFRTALRAKYWITNTNIQRGLRFKKKNQIYLNTWHGIPLKHIGNDCPGRKDYHFGSVDYLTVSGDYEERVFKSAFHAGEDCFLRCGMPRNQALWLADEQTRQAMRERLGISSGKRVILYAPTWRDSRDRGRSYTIEPPVHFPRWKAALGENYLILFRAHHQTTRVLGIRFDDFVRDVSQYPDVNDLMIAADFLITDYSAIAFDYSILCRPIFCYAYDYDSYLAERGTYFSVDERYPNKSCRTEEELLERITHMDYEAECANTKRFRDAFVQYGSNATECCLQALFGTEPANSPTEPTP